MILPSKHISLSESLLGLGGIILFILKKPATIDDIWKKYLDIQQNNRVIHAYHNFDHLVLALNYLYLIEAISLDDNGTISKCA
jgi:hypothetical protein